RLFFKSSTNDFHCGLRAVSKDAFLKMNLSSTGMEFASEMVMKATLTKLRVAEIPITLHKDGRSRQPHLRSWRDGWRHLRFMLLHSPRWLFIYPGLALITIGVAGSALLARHSVRITPRLELDVHSLMVACFAILIGVQLMMFGALA